MKHLLIVYHSQSGRTRAMAEAVAHGASDAEAEDVEIRLKNAFAAGVEDLLWADGLVLGTPENFGYMSGGMKDFLDRTFYPCEGKLEGTPYAVFISAGNDGTGALASIRRIANGYAFREVQEPIIAKGELGDDSIARCTELGLAFASALEMGVF